MRSKQVLPRVPAGTNQEHARLHNRCVILDAIRQAGQLTRAELTRLTALSAQTVSNVIAQLQREGMLLAHAPQSIPHGQPPIPFSLNPEGGLSIGFYITRNHLTSVLMDLTGKIRLIRFDDINYSTFHDVLPLLTKIVNSFRTKLCDMRILGIGVALPGLDRDGASSEACPMDAPQWGDQASLTALGVETGLSVFVASDANATAVGERLYGAAKELRDFVYLFMGHELRAVLFLGNQIYVGRRRHAGQIGHFIQTPNGRPCPCGKRGRLGCHASEACLLVHLGVETSRGVEALDVNNYTSGVKRFVDGAVPALRYATDILESLLDPESIVIGGTIPRAILQTLVEQSFPHTQSADTLLDAPPERIQLGNAGPECVALGAASTVMLAQFGSDRSNTPWQSSEQPRVL